MKQEECTIGKSVEYKGKLLKVASHVDDEGRVYLNSGKKFNWFWGIRRVDELNEVKEK